MSVNGVNVENVEHAFVIRLLKEAKDFIHLVIKRKLNQSLVATLNNNTNNITNTTTNNHSPLPLKNPNLASLNDLITSQQQQQQPYPNDVNGRNDLNNKRHNLAIQQTAATVMANYANTYQNGNGAATVTPNGCGSSTTTTTNTPTTSNNLMSIMMNSSTSLSSMKPIKICLNKKDKKESFGIILGCKYYIKDILPNSLAASEPSLKKVGHAITTK